MKLMFNLLIKFIQKVLFVEWTGYDLNSKSIDYIIGHYRLYEMTKDVPGHIIELGTGSGRNALIFGRIIKINSQDKYKNVYGFDTFTGFPQKVLKANKTNKNFSSKRFKEYNFTDVKLRMTKNKLKGVVHLIKGVLPESINHFVYSEDFNFNKDGLRVSIVYVDCNDYETSIKSLEILKEYLSKGSIIAIDENRLGGETKALQYFSDKYGYPIKQWNYGGVISGFIKID